MKLLFLSIFGVFDESFLKSHVDGGAFDSFEASAKDGGEFGGCLIAR